jgi:PAP2 superfamily
MRLRWTWVLLVLLLGAAAYAGTVPATPNSGATRGLSGAALPATPVIDWSNEARRAIVPPGAGPENFGNKFPGEAGIYMGIVHAAIYDAALAIEGGYEPYAIALSAADASPEAAIATAAHHTLVGPPGVGLQPALGLNPTQQTILDDDYAAYMDAIPDGEAKASGIAVGEQVAAAILALRTNDGRDANPPFNPPESGPGVWEPDPSRPVLGLRIPGITPLALESASQFRPDGPNPLTSDEYAEDLAQLIELGGADSTARTPEQTGEALFWTDHDSRQWNDGLLAIAVDEELGLVETARMLALAHVAGSDALIACFDAKYTYWFWRPYQAIAGAADDGNPATEPVPGWAPLRPTPNHPEYPSAHACHTSAVATALAAFFGTDRVEFTLDSRIAGAPHEYTFERFRDAVKSVNRARVFAGFHFRNSDLEGSTLGRDVGSYVVDHFFQPLR